jgi:hypothetical protein
LCGELELKIEKYNIDMQLYALQDDYCLSRLVATAALSSMPVTVTCPVTADELAKVAPLATGGAALVLPDASVVVEPLAMLKALCGPSPDAHFCSTSLLAEMDQASSMLEVPLQVSTVWPCVLLLRVLLSMPPVLT